MRSNCCKAERAASKSLRDRHVTVWHMHRGYKEWFSSTWSLYKVRVLPQPGRVLHLAGSTPIESLPEKPWPSLHQGACVLSASGSPDGLLVGLASVPRVIVLLRSWL